MSNNHSRVYEKRCFFVLFISCRDHQVSRFRVDFGLVNVLANRLKNFSTASEAQKEFLTCVPTLILDSLRCRIIGPTNGVPTTGNGMKIVAIQTMINGLLLTHGNHMKFNLQKFEFLQNGRPLPLCSMMN